MLKWYVVHTYSGHENKAKLSLLDRVRQAGMNEKFGDILIPTDTVVELRMTTGSMWRPPTTNPGAQPSA